MAEGSQQHSIIRGDAEARCSLQTNHVDIFGYIDQMLMEEDMDDDARVLEASSDFQAKERSFYELLGQKYPYSNTSSRSSCADGAGANLVDQSSTNTPSTDYDASSNTETRVIRDSSKSSLPSGSKMLDDNDREGTDGFNDLWIYTLGGREKEFAACITDLKSVKGQGNGKPKACSRSKKRKGKEEVIDLMPLLMTCAKSYADDNHNAANVLLRQIRRTSSSFGDANQRLAHYFADGLEARLAGTGSRMQKSPVYERSASSDYLRVYCTSLMFSSFRKISIYASNNMISIRAEKEPRVHVVDFGISYGFQWPPFIQRLSRREGGPPKLRITGVDFPQPGVQPEERIEETGHRLARYAKAFGVPFEYKAISRKWESIRVEDLEIEEGEFVAVNCLYKGKSLLDETGVSESSRSLVLDLIRRIKPNIFVHGIINGGYSVPFFIRRFQEALFHFSALFDMIETILSRESPGRLLIERDILGNEIMNVIACEGRERVERPETYKHWQLRLLKAGLVQLPFKRKLRDTILNKVRNSYHREFLVFEDAKWLLMSWKGRTISALSCWQAS